eukprot:5779763-Amphidinium_carterae.1
MQHPQDEQMKWNKTKNTVHTNLSVLRKAQTYYTNLVQTNSQNSIVIGHKYPTSGWVAAPLAACYLQLSLRTSDF